LGLLHGRKKHQCCYGGSSAVDNYSENPLLKGIEQDGKVSLNLKLKREGQFSGDMSIGGGLFEGGKAVHQDNVTVLGITKKV
jgi:hypothetical protein